MQETHLPGNADFVHLPCYFLITFTRWFFFFFKEKLVGHRLVTLPGPGPSRDT